LPAARYYTKVVQTRRVSPVCWSLFQPGRDQALFAADKVISETMPAKNAENERLAGRLRIAVIDDDESFLRSLGRLLRSVGYTVNTYSSGRDFLAALSDSLPHFIVADVHMPQMSGLELLEQLASQGYSLPFILVTAYDTPQTRERARKAGCLGLLLKPFDNQELLRFIREAIGRGPTAPGTADRGKPSQRLPPDSC